MVDRLRSHARETRATKLPTERLALYTRMKLAEGGYIERSEPVVLIGECGFLSIR